MQTIKLNLIPGSVMPVVNVSQYDVNRQFALSVYEGAASLCRTYGTGIGMACRGAACRQAGARCCGLL